MNYVQEQLIRFVEKIDVKNIEGIFFELKRFPISKKTKPLLATHEACY